MTTSIESMVTAAKAKNPAQFTEGFKGAMAEKLAEALENRKRLVANAIFNKGE